MGLKNNNGESSVGLSWQGPGMFISSVMDAWWKGKQWWGTALPSLPLSVFFPKSFGGIGFTMQMEQVKFIEKQGESWHYYYKGRNFHSVIQETMTGEADRVINAIKLIVRDEMGRITGTQMLKGKQAACKMTEPVAEGSTEDAPCFGEVPESSCEDVSEDVMAFLADL